MSDTPRTDAFYATRTHTMDTAGDALFARELGDHSRTLERDNARLQARVEELETALRNAIPALDEMVKLSNGVGNWRSEHLWRCDADAARKLLDFADEHTLARLSELERENTALREQLAEARKTSLERDVALVRAGIHAEKYTVRAGQIDPTAIARGIPK